MVISHQGGLICHNIPIVRIPIVRWMTINSIHLLTMARIKLIIPRTIPIIPINHQISQYIPWNHQIIFRLLPFPRKISPKSVGDIGYIPGKPQLNPLEVTIKSWNPHEGRRVSSSTASVKPWESPDPAGPHRPGSRDEGLSMVFMETTQDLTTKSREKTIEKAMPGYSTM